jgi:hypothetical protein
MSRGMNGVSCPMTVVPGAVRSDGKGMRLCEMSFTVCITMKVCTR